MDNRLCAAGRAAPRPVLEVIITVQETNTMTTTVITTITAAAVAWILIMTRSPSTQMGDVKIMAPLKQEQDGVLLFPQRTIAINQLNFVALSLLIITTLFHWELRNKQTTQQNYRQLEKHYYIYEINCPKHYVLAHANTTLYCHAPAHHCVVLFVMTRNTQQMLLQPLQTTDATETLSKT